MPYTTIMHYDTVLVELESVTTVLYSAPGSRKDVPTQVMLTRCYAGVLSSCLLSSIFCILSDSSRGLDDL
jgi:hypothetical protein